VRQIRKLVLTGKEAWNLWSSDQPDVERYYYKWGKATPSDYDLICTHFRFTNYDGNFEHIRLGGSNRDDFVIFISKAIVSTVEDFKAYLATQYANGTPVTAWYTLATPENAIVNEPLAKIGNYADEFSSSDAGVTIPTIKGTNTLTVDTTLPPSQTTVKYLGIDNVYKDTWEVRDNQDRLLWYREDTLTGTSSISYKGYGIPLKSMKIVGNTIQNGTPSPDNIIIPDFCGERTRNLAYGRIESVNIGTNGKIVQTDVYDLAIARVENGVVYTANSYVLAFYTDEPVIGSVSYNQSRIVGNTGIPTTFTAPITGYVVFRIAPSEPAMLNLGSTALPYEPYGYKIPITCAGQTVPIYLGEVQTVRRVKKFVLTGDENIELYTISTGNLFRIDLPSLRVLGQFKDAGLCTHYRAVIRSSDRVNGTISGGNVASVQGVVDIVDDYATVADFKSYLAAQYAAGTPVTVWYVLATPENAIVNEPLCKIGDYADELITVPGITPQTGTNTLTVDTTLSPSSVSITGHIKAIGQ
jgi:hypothetical protein